jgi:hypothetical protein
MTRTGAGHPGPLTDTLPVKKRDRPGRWFDVGIKVVGEIWGRRMRK